MRLIFKVAKAELRNLFYSPVAWFLSIVFFIQCAIFFTNKMSLFAKWQDTTMYDNPKFRDLGHIALTQSIFLGGSNSLFSNVLQNLYLFVPLLTMGIISREINSGTIKLLYSSPIKLRQIVLGKYLAIILYNLLLVMIVGVFAGTGLFNIKSADYGLLLSAMLGFYLLVCTYSAIGMFLSSLTTYQIVSAIGTFLLIFVLSYIGTLWQEYDFVRDLTYFLSLQGRTGHMLRGLIVTKDVLYFIIMTLMFLGFTVLKLKGSTASIPLPVKVGRYLLVIVVALGVGYIGSKPSLTGYWDTTARNNNTLNERTRKIIKDLGEGAPLEVTLYTNLLGMERFKGFPKQRNEYLAGMWEPYLRFSPDIKFKYVYYYDYDSTLMGNWLYRQSPGKTVKQIAEKQVEDDDANISGILEPDSIQKVVDLRAENLRLVMQLKHKGRTTFLRTFDDNLFWPTEQQVAAALKRLQQARLPRVLFVSGDLERNINKKGEREYYLHSLNKKNRPSLVNSGFDVDTISLNNDNIPDNISSLVLADPKTNLSPASILKLKDYIDKGGNMFILGEPGKQDILNPLLQQLGVQLSNGILVQPTKYEMPQMLLPDITGAGLDLAEETPLVLQKEALALKETEDNLKIMMPGATSISYATNNPFTIKPLLVLNSREAWIKMGKLVSDSADVVYSPQEGDVKGTFPTCVSLTRNVNNKEQRIVLCSDADFLSNSRMTNHYFGYAIYSWLDNNRFPIYPPVRPPKDNLLKISNKGVTVERIVFVWVVPGLILLLAAVFLIRRKGQ